MKFSLAMPTRNMASYIGAAVQSALTQNGASVELLVQDACSTDQTEEVLVSLDDARLSVVSEPDEGQADAINRALARSSGDVLGWLNADDELEPGALERVATVFEREPSTLLVYGRGAYIDEAGSRLRPYDVRPFDPSLLLTRDYILQPAAFWRRSLWDEVGPLDTSLSWGFDWDWFIRASRRTSFRFLDAELARYRITGENKSLSGGAERQEELARIARRHGGVLQPTYLYWCFTLLKRRVPLVGPLEPVLWRLFPGRIMA
jgi:glycosyltransferase involved in cell wall biosynthesis